MTPYEVGFEDGISGRNHRRPEGFDGAALTEYAHGYNAGEASYMSTVPEIVQAPRPVSTLPPVFDGTHSWVTTGAWASRLLGRKVWQTMFAGTHQRVPFHTIGRTTGRSLRAMRRALERAAIPAVVAEMPLFQVVRTPDHGTRLERVR